MLLGEHTIFSTKHDFFLQNISNLLWFSHEVLNTLHTLTVLMKFLISECLCCYVLKYGILNQEVLKILQGAVRICKVQ